MGKSSRHPDTEYSPHDEVAELLAGQSAKTPASEPVLSEADLLREQEAIRVAQDKETTQRYLAGFARDAEAVATSNERAQILHRQEQAVKAKLAGFDSPLDPFDGLDPSELPAKPDATQITSDPALKVNLPTDTADDTSLSLPSIESPSESLTQPKPQPVPTQLAGPESVAKKVEPTGSTIKHMQEQLQYWSRRRGAIQGRLNSLQSDIERLRYDPKNQKRVWRLEEKAMDLITQREPIDKDIVVLQSQIELATIKLTASPSLITEKKRKSQQYRISKIPVGKIADLIEKTRYERVEPSDMDYHEHNLTPQAKQPYHNTNANEPNIMTNNENHELPDDSQANHQEILADALARIRDMDPESSGNDVITSDTEATPAESTPAGARYNEAATRFAQGLRADTESTTDAGAETTEHPLPAMHEPIQVGGREYRVGEIISYTENDGDQTELIVKNISQDANPGLILYDLVNNRTFAISADRLASVRGGREIPAAGDPDPTDPGDPPPPVPPGDGTTPGDPTDPDDGEPIPTDIPAPAPPPGDGTEPGPDDDGDPGGEPTEPTVDLSPELAAEIPRVPTFDEVARDAASLRTGLDTQIRVVAEAKESREKLWNLRREKRVEKLAEEQTKLSELHTEYLGAWAYRIAQIEGMGGELDAKKSELGLRHEEKRTDLARLEASDEPEGVKAIQRERLNNEIAQLNAGMQECDRRKQEASLTAESMRLRMTEAMVQDLAEVRTRVEEEQQSLKEGSLSQKFKNAWRAHPKARIAIGVGLGVAGFALSGPLGLAAMAGGVAMRGAGGYMGTEAAVNMGHNWRANRAEQRAQATGYDGVGEADRASAESMRGSLERSGGDGPDAAVEQRLASEFLLKHPLAPEQIAAVLRGEADASASIAAELIKDQTERLASDAQSNRRAKVAGAMVGTTLAVLGVVRGLDHVATKPGDPTPPPTGDPAPTPPVGDPDYVSAAYNRYLGVVTSSKDAGASFANMVDNPNPAFKFDNWSQLDQSFLDAAKGMPKPQFEAFNRVIGRLTTVPGRGTEWVSQNMDLLGGQIRRGLSANQLVRLYGAGPENL